LRIKQLRNYLGSTDAAKEETYWSLIKETQVQMEQLRAQPLPSSLGASLNVRLVRNLMACLKTDWGQFSAIVRNQLLQLFLERVELRITKKCVEATVIWKVGLRQSLVIERPEFRGGVKTAWSEDEKEILRQLWPAATKSEIAAALPKRSWKGINSMAFKLGTSRIWIHPAPDVCRHWTEDEDARLKQIYGCGRPLLEIAESLGRSLAGVACRLRIKGLSRPMPSRKAIPIWHLKEDNLVGSDASGRGRSQRV
jgi:hypothetical protein